MYRILKACNQVCPKKRGGEIMEIHGGGMKMCRRQCLRVVLQRIRGGIKA